MLVVRRCTSHSMYIVHIVLACNSMSNNKRPSLRGEQRRLSSDEPDWNLDGGVLRRTRGRGKGSSSTQSSEVASEEESKVDSGTGEETVSAVTEHVESEDDEAQGTTSTARTRSGNDKPTHTRIILEVVQLEEAFKNVPCSECGETIQLEIRTVCLASSIRLVCNNVNCSYVSQLNGPCKTTMHEDERCSYERMSDYAVNVLYVLGFISMGDAHTEAGRLLGLLGLPNDTTMMNRSFGIIEGRLSFHLRQLCEEVIAENIDEEARLSMSEVDYNVWMAWKKDAATVGDLPHVRWPHIDGTYDMAWQQKGSGKVYNSQSGHGTLFGRFTRKCIGLVIKSKLCSYCNTFQKKHPDTDVPLHECWKNHDGSSGSMESSGAVEVLTESFDKWKFVVKRLCCDDDSSIRADCQWSNADYMKNNNTTVLPMVKKKNKDGTLKETSQPRPDKGKLPGHVPEPQFVADPNHRRKGLTGELISIDTSKKDAKMTMTRMDSTRIGKNFGYMARTLKDRPEAEYVDAARACLEHHFDNHEFCGDWCKRKTESEESKRRLIKFYRCKKNDAALYALLQSKMERFVTKERLLEMAHGLDTNMNEAFNQICTWLAPKNKVFAGTCSLRNRIALAVIINSIGVELCFKRLLKKLGIAITPNVAYYLHTKEKSRVKRLSTIRTRAAKQKKNKRKYDKLKEATLQAKKEFHKRQGTYRSGMNLEDPFASDEDEARNHAAKKTKKAKEFCPFCGKSGHLTQKSKKCTAPPNSVMVYRREDGTLLADDPVVAPHPPNENELAQIDCDLMDSMPFDADYDSDIELQTLGLAMTVGLEDSDDEEGLTSAI
jgi:hypothetical protein